MSAKPRCHDCKHLRGHRALGRIVTAAAKDSKTKGAQPHTGSPKKASCHCVCHGG